MKKSKPGAAPLKKAARAPRLGTITSADGFPWTSEDVRDRIAPELLAIARLNAVDVPMVSAKQIYAYMRANRESVLWHYMPSDKRAIEMTHLEYCRKFIRSVRVVTANVPGVHGEAMLVNVDDVPTFRDADGKERRGRTNVLASDARERFDLSSRVASARFALVAGAFRQLEFWCRTSNVPEHYVDFVASMREAIDMFEASRAAMRDKAAE